MQRFSNIRNYFLISENNFWYQKSVACSDIKNNFWYQKTIFGYQKLLFWYQEIIFWYQKLTHFQKIVFWYQKLISDIKKSFSVIRKSALKSYLAFHTVATMLTTIIILFGCHGNHSNHALWSATDYLYRLLGGISNYWCISKKTAKLHVTGLCKLNIFLMKSMFPCILQEQLLP